LDEAVREALRETPVRPRSVAEDDDLRGGLEEATVSTMVTYDGLVRMDDPTQVALSQRIPYLNIERGQGQTAVVDVPSAAIQRNDFLVLYHPGVEIPSVFSGTDLFTLAPDTKKAAQQLTAWEGRRTVALVDPSLVQSSSSQATWDTLLRSHNVVGIPMTPDMLASFEPLSRDGATAFLVAVLRAAEGGGLLNLVGAGIEEARQDTKVYLYL
jgi:hypothetical protein